MEGPRGATAKDRETMCALADTVFANWAKKNAESAIRFGFPHLFCDENLENCRVVVEDGKVVSLVAITVRDAALLGCSVRVANLGAVSTAPECRGRGYASLCLYDAFARARGLGVDFVMISGSRSMYTRAGSLYAGRTLLYTMTREAAAGFPKGGVAVAKASASDLGEIMSCYQLEPVRYVRPRDHWEKVVTPAGVNRQSSAQTYTVRVGRTLAAYLAVGRPGENGQCGIVEYAGDRAAIVAAMAEILRSNGPAGLGISVGAYDCALCGRLDALCLTPKAVHAGGTVRIENFEQFMARMRPLFVELAGWKDAARLAFQAVEAEHEADCRFRFLVDGRVVAECARGQAAQIIFGTVEREEEKLMAPGPGADLLKRVFPLPRLQYGFSYV